MIEYCENPLDTALRIVANEPTYQPDFQKILLDSKIYIIGQTASHASDVQPVLMPGQNIAILNWENRNGFPVIPIFSSLHHLQTCIDQQVNYMAFPARILFTMTLGAILILNPKSEYMKELMPTEITGLLKHPVLH